MAAKEPPKKKGASSRHPDDMEDEEGGRPTKKEESCPIMYAGYVWTVPVVVARRVWLEHGGLWLSRVPDDQQLLSLPPS